MSAKALQLYISEQLYKFCFGQRCCMKFLGFLFSLDRQHFIKSTNDLSLGMHTYVHDGQEHVIVFKDSCCHILKEPPSLKMQKESFKEMYMMKCGSESSGGQEMNVKSNFANSRNTPVVPQHRFSLGPLKQSLAHPNKFALQSIECGCPFAPYREAILKILLTNRVLVINGGPKCDKSTILPMYIINNCAEKNAHCKIICVEREDLVAIYNSERVAERFQEKVGETVAYQIQLQSRISDSSNLVYTTSFFLLRVLMGQSIVDSFRHISHVIVVDAHLHEAYADLLLRQLKEALLYHQHLKVILLSNSRNNCEFLNYFGEGQELFVDTTNDIHGKKLEVLYLEDILESLPETRISSGITKAFSALPVKNNITNSKHLDRCLEFYERMATDQYFDSFIYMIKGECCNINYRHSITGRTAIIIASLLGKLNHIKTLLQLNADPYISDNENTNALKAAISMGYKECVDILQMSSYEQKISAVDGSNKDYIDYHLILDILQMINSNKRFKVGNIIVFLPAYQHLVKLNYLILKQKLLGNIPENMMVFLLHNSIDKTDLETIIQKWPNMIKLILATDIAESLMCFDDIEYVIDTARHYRCIYNYRNMCKEYVYEWSPKDSMENRSLLLNKATGGFCFRLISQNIYNKLPEFPTPEILNMHLDRVCLSVKLLSPNTMVAEYLQEAIVKPPFIQIYRTVESLKKINVFTDLEDITWLGCRLIDVPVECYLGKILVFAILLQCLDPVLTIVSFLSTLDPLELSHYMNHLNEPFKDLLRYNIKAEKQRLSEGISSDHFMYLRLYQEWQNNFRNEEISLELNEYHFILNGLLEHVCNMRTQLVGSLRSSQLIHSKGDLSMHYINQKSNCWSVIKAALVGGMYPNICVVDSNVNRIKSPCKRELVLHSNSVLRPLDLYSMSSLKLASPCIVYGKETNSVNCNSIECNTVVTPITFALFAGPTKMTSSSIQVIRNQPQKLQNQLCYFRIDDWISFVADYKEAQLILKTRQSFYNMYENYLQYCGCLESHKRPHHILTLTQNTRLFDCLEKILTQEDIANGFVQPEKIGLRPKALPNQFIINHSAYTLLTKSCYRISKNRNSFAANNQLLKQFFMIYNVELNENKYTYYNCEWYHLLSAMLSPSSVENKLTFVISYSLNPDYLHGVYIAECDTGVLKLHFCFKCDINIFDILNQVSSTSSIFLAVSTRRVAIQLDNETGEFLLNVFAVRNNWLHS
ncbi:benign gonial cell neoplasm protein [Calliphora vicina]|uniref:benign gonial cell neoplasm protein n=1 Tax=Calliphora vicina TaxID=7373 RepID=UPI00325B88BB